jgi:hypothetical protein
LADPPWLVAVADGVELLIHARPGAKRSAIAGVHGPALGIRLGARPVEGAANAALIRVLAEALGVSRQAVTLRTGARGRTKRVHVRGVTAGVTLARLAPYL